MALEVGQDVWVNGVKGVVVDTYRPIGTYREFKIRLVTGQTVNRTRMQIDSEDPFQLSEVDDDELTTFLIPRVSNRNENARH